MSVNTNAPTCQKRCTECNRAHYDQNYTNCVECGAILPEESTGYDF